MVLFSKDKKLLKVSQFSLPKSLQSELNIPLTINLSKAFELFSIKDDFSLRKSETISPEIFCSSTFLFLLTSVLSIFALHIIKYEHKFLILFLIP